MANSNRVCPSILIELSIHEANLENRLVAICEHYCIFRLKPECEWRQGVTHSRIIGCWHQMTCPFTKVNHRTACGKTSTKNTENAHFRSLLAQLWRLGKVSEQRKHQKPAWVFHRLKEIDALPPWMWQSIRGSKEIRRLQKPSCHQQGAKNYSSCPDHTHASTRNPYYKGTKHLCAQIL